MSVVCVIVTVDTSISYCTVAVCVTVLSQQFDSPKLQSLLTGVVVAVALDETRRRVCGLQPRPVPCNNLLEACAHQRLEESGH